LVQLPKNALKIIIPTNKFSFLISVFFMIYSKSQDDFDPTK